MSNLTFFAGAGEVVCMEVSCRSSVSVLLLRLGAAPAIEVQNSIFGSQLSCKVAVAIAGVRFCR
jgi:hypothetical protein